ncbi:MAG: Re/Si-specific NAD(P)(+) transhydrogenase subunit alpha [Myxococcota bacterium]
MLVAIAKEVLPGEKRVAASPDSVRKLIGLGFEVAVESGAGTAACYTDDAYLAAGARIEADVRALWSAADVLLKVRPPAERPDLSAHEVDLLHEGACLVSFIWPARSTELLDRMAARKLTVLAMDQIPRISRAQKMDALSSMANISGYRAIVEAASHFGSFFTGQMTAAGKVNPAKVLVIGAGVAGLAALGAAKSLGGIVRAFDTRAAVKDQVKSMGAEFLEVKIQEDGEGGGGYAREMSPEFIAAEMALFRAQAKEVDIVVTTALIPGKPAPKLWLKDMVELMKPGSVIVDLAAETGGNCDLTVPDEAIVHNGVTILGYTDLPSRLATTSSQLYAQNLVHLLTDMGGGANWRVDFEDEVVRGATVLRDGELTWPPPAKPVPVAAPTAVETPAGTAIATKPKAKPPGSAKSAPLTWIMVGILVLTWLGLHFGATHAHVEDPRTVEMFFERLTVFVLACFVGWQVVWNVTPALHTPLMSVTNAISGIILIGGVLHTVGDPLSAPVLLGMAAVLLATINVAGGFLVTRRMLKMFRK